MINTLLMLLLPLGVWIGVYHEFFTGHLFLGCLDNYQAFHYAAYYVNALIHGTYPLWNPFRSWGVVDNFDMIFMGGLNPLYLLMAGLVFVGVPVYGAFFFVIVLYFWIGCLGFYFLARQIIGGVAWPFLAYVLLLFSTLGVNVILQLGLVLVFVPLFWFFVFLIGFTRAQRSIDRLFHALGLTFALMIIAGTYIPMHFLVIILCFSLASIVVAWAYVCRLWTATLLFIRAFPWVFLLCVLGVILACLPSAFWYQDVHGGQMMMHNPRSTDVKNVTEASWDMIKAGGLAAWTSWGEMFTDFNAGENYTSYVSVIIFVFFGLSLFNRTRRVQIVLLISGVLLLLILLVDTTPIFTFLYQHFSVFHLFHNYFSIGVFIVALAILFFVGEAKEFALQRSICLRARILRLFYIFIVHVLFFLFLLHLDNVPKTSFITLILSGLWFVLWELNFGRMSERIFVGGLALIAIVGPIQVLPYSTPLGGVLPYTYSLNKPTFSYMRPLEGSGYNEEDGYYRLKLGKDESGFVKANYTGTAYAYELYAHIPKESLRGYVAHKFIVYDRTVLLNRDNPDWSLLADHLARLKNEAMVTDKDAVKEMRGRGELARAIKGPDKELEVKTFDFNSIRVQTDFSSKKFLVYNDSYYEGWQVFIDGKPVPLYRANGAFKGVWVDAGRHLVYFRFAKARCCLFIFLLSFVLGWWIALIVLLKKTGKVLC